MIFWWYEGIDGGTALIVLRFAALMRLASALLGLLKLVVLISKVLPRLTLVGEDYRKPCSALTLAHSI